MRNWMWCVGVAIGLAMPLDAAEWEITQLTDFDGSDGRHRTGHRVDVSDAYVAWVEEEPEKGEVYGARRYDGNEIRILSSGIDYGSSADLQISGESVFWVYLPSEWRLFPELVMYDGERTIMPFAHLATGGGPEGLYDVSGQYVAWMEQEGDVMSPGSKFVHLTDRALGQDRIFMEVEHGPDQSEPQVNGSQMIWRERDGIHLYDIQSDSQQLLPDTEGARNLDLSDTHIVWRQGEQREGYEIFLYEIESGTKTQLTDNDRVDDSPAISGGNVAWWGSDGHDSEIFFYDGNSTRQVTDNEFPDAPYGEMIAISGSYVAWAGEDGNDREIFVYDGDSVIQLTDNDYKDRNPRIDGSRIAWSGHVDEDIEVFLATRIPEPGVIALLITGAVVLLLRRGKRLLR